MKNQDSKNDNGLDERRDQAREEPNKPNPVHVPPLIRVQDQEQDSYEIRNNVCRLLRGGKKGRKRGLNNVLVFERESAGREEDFWKLLRFQKKIEDER